MVAVSHLHPPLGSIVDEVNNEVICSLWSVNINIETAVPRGTSSIELTGGVCDIPVMIAGLPPTFVTIYIPVNTF